MDKSMKPPIRFSRFTDTWEQRKLSELINDIADGPFGSNLKSVHYTDKKEVRIIQLSNIGESGWQDGNVRYTTFEHAKEIKRSVVEKSELVMAKMMPAGLTIERPNTDKMYVLSSDAVRIKPNYLLLDSKYFVCMTKCDYFLNQINNDAQGSTRTRTSISKIRKMDIPVPSLSEQQQIGRYFFNIDNLITLHKRKYDKLQNVKKFMLEKIFPKDGADVPEIRFKGFSGAWEQSKLSDYLVTSSEKNFEDIYSKQDVLSVSGNFGIVNQIEFQGRSFAGVSVSNYGIVNTGDVVYTKSPLSSNPYGIIKTNKGKTGIVSTLYAVYHPTEKADSNFVQVYFEQNARVNNYLHPLVNKGAKNDMKVTADNALKGLVMFPKYEEQKQISALFEALDNLITFHQRELEKLQNLKEALLEKMFV